MQETIGRDGDTVKLLRECDAGIKMGISSINDVVDDVRDKRFRELLHACRSAHEKLSIEVGELLDDHLDAGKEPNPLLIGMGKVKTGARLLMNHSDKTVADLMTDGCNMGVKSLSRYLNQYKSADNKSKDIAERLVDLELQLTEDIREYL